MKGIIRPSMEKPNSHPGNALPNALNPPEEVE
jgi:hypothetical protein